jgi:hypothetical protein
MFCAMGNDGTHLFSLGPRRNIWQPNHFSIRTALTTLDHATNRASRMCIVLYQFYWSLGNKRVAGAYNCRKRNNFIEYQWYVRVCVKAHQLMSYLSILHADYWSGISSGNIGTG